MICNTAVFLKCICRSEIRAAEEVAKRAPCADFDKFKPLFRAVQDDLKSGRWQARRFKVDASIEQGNFFILGGQIAYVADVGESDQDIGEGENPTPAFA